VCKAVAPKPRKTAPPAIAVIVKIAKTPINSKILTSKPPADNAAVEVARCAVIAVVPAMARAKVSPQDRPSDKSHIHIIQYAVRAIF
jgi:hypothetical protein